MPIGRVAVRIVAGQTISRQSMLCRSFQTPKICCGSMPVTNRTCDSTMSLPAHSSSGKPSKADANPTVACTMADVATIRQDQRVRDVKKSQAGAGSTSASQLHVGKSTGGKCPQNKGHISLSAFVILSNSHRSRPDC